MSIPPEHVRVAIVGSGFSGLGAAIRLSQEGIDDVLVLEKAEGVGGVWRDNLYPGCACDVQSHLYSFSFAPNPSWTRAYSPQREIRAYLKHCAEAFGVLPRIRFGCELLSARWEEGRWHLSTSRGPLTADVVVLATGALSAPAIPEIPGLGTFSGAVMHSARWDQGVDLEGKRVAVVGTGASAIQIVPAIQKRVASMLLVQRTAPWVLPQLDHGISGVARRLYGVVPALQRLLRGLLYLARELLALGFLHPPLLAAGQVLARAYLRSQVADPALRRKLTPDYTLGCKRVLLSSTYLKAVAAPNVELVSGSVEGIEGPRLRTSAGEREVDVLILATGFHVMDMPIAGRIRGRDGRTLEEVWAGSPSAHLGTTMPGYPNLFVILGPGTGLAHSSVLIMMEAQLEHLLKALRYMKRWDLAALEPTAQAQARWTQELDRRSAGTVWVRGGCRSWYLDRTGRNSALWPGFVAAYTRQARSFDPEDYAPVAA